MENKLQRNFRSIVDALLLNQAKVDNLNEQHLLVKQKHQKQIKQLKDKIKQMNKQIGGKKHQEQKLKTQIHLNDNQDKLQQISQKKLTQKSIKMNPSNKIINNTNNLDNLNQLNQIKYSFNKWQQQKQNYMNQINQLKNKLSMLGYFQGQIDQIKNQMNQMKSQLAMKLGEGSKSNLKSNKSIVKRQSIINLVNNKQNQKQVIQPVLSKRSIKALGQDKQNTQTNNNSPNITQLLDKQLNNVYLQLNTFRISFQQLKDIVSDNKKQIYKHNNSINQLKDDLKNQIKIRKQQNQDINKQIKQLKMELLNVGDRVVQFKGDQNKNNTQKQSNKVSSNNQDNVNYKNNINDKLSKLQYLITQMPNQAQFSKFKNDINDTCEKLNQKLQTLTKAQQDIQTNLLDKIAEHNHQNQQQFKQIKNKINEMQQNNKIQLSQNQRKHNIVLAKNEQLKKSLQNLRQDLQFYQTLMNENNSKDKKSNHSNSNNDKQQGKQQNSSTMNNINDKLIDDLKRQFNNKIHDMRTNLLNIIRDLQRKLSNNKPNIQQQIIKIWDKITQLNLFLNKKADQDDCKKTFMYLEKKINRLNSSVFKNDDNTEDARIARSNQWNCLSCDKNLHSYQGKLGKHIVWDSMPLKGVSKTVLTNNVNNLVNSTSTGNLNSININDDKKKQLPQLNKRI